jgi:hypothetical protein
MHTVRNGNFWPRPCKTRLEIYSRQSITHTGDLTSTLDVVNGVVPNRINSSGELSVTNSTLQGLVLNQEGATLRPAFR